MMKEKYETLPLTTLKELAKARGLKGISTMKKAQVIELMLQEDEKEQEKEKAAERAEMSKQLNKYFGEGTVMSTGVYSFDMSLIGNQSCWQFMNSYNFSGDSIDVLWECFDKANNVVAYVTAKYHADSNSFDNVSQHMTTLGQTYMGVTGSDNASEKIDTTDTTTIFDVMQNAGISEETRKELEDYHNDKEAMDAKEANEAARDALKNSSNK